MVRPSWRQGMIWIMLHGASSVFVRCFRPVSRCSTRSCQLRYVVRPSMRLMATFDNDKELATPTMQPMENLYREWSLEQDEELWGHRTLPLPELAARVGRGLRGVEQRLEKLKNVNHAAYQRLFKTTMSSVGSQQPAEKPKLVPVTEVIRRIKWSLDPSDFSFLHFDRVDDIIVESPFSAPNQSVSGKATLLIDAIPEHRIMAVKYRERIVWDKRQRIDLVFANGGIALVIKSYDDWMQDQVAAEESAKRKQQQVSAILQQLLGQQGLQQLQERTLSLSSAAGDPTVSTKAESEKYTAFALNLIQAAPSSAAIGDVDALDLLSEFVALLPDDDLRRVLLTEISLCMSDVAKADTTAKPRGTPSVLPELNEDDIIETFIRGSGPGGQKINKTSNRVLLIHKATQLRVECQDTRSLQQNRKLARKRLRLKLDEYLNGSQSVERMKASKASDKKQKAKARARKRQRQKHQANASDDEYELLN
ncbi:hypothetical protein MPSEU_000274800 [Mayamaea pseudoterrestris]|nr:hypothetical protein MPSEU_000274800 [Mayamaea pseudoterrestris]